MHECILSEHFLSLFLFIRYRCSLESTISQLILVEFTNDKDFIFLLVKSGLTAHFKVQHQITFLKLLQLQYNVHENKVVDARG